MSAYVAALPMYDWPEMRAETDALWAGLRDRLRAAGIDAPQTPARRNADLPAVPGGIRDAAGRVIAPDPATLPPDGLDLAALWRHPRLLVGQTCWGPLEHGLSAHVQVVGQPSYDGIEGGAGAFYSSAVVMRRRMFAGAGAADKPQTPLWPAGHLPLKGGDQPAARLSPITSVEEPAPTAPLPISPLEGEMAGRPEGGVGAPADGRSEIPLDRLRGLRLAFNDADSMSGFLALARDLEAAGPGLAVFAERIETGAHRASLRAVAAGDADVAAIDCRSWALARRFEPAARELEVVGWTARRKGLPYVTAKATPPETAAALREILAAA